MPAAGFLMNLFLPATNMMVAMPMSIPGIPKCPGIKVLRHVGYADLREKCADIDTKRRGQMLWNKRFVAIVKLVAHVGRYTWLYTSGPKGQCRQDPH